MSKKALQQAQAERLTLLVADNKAGYSGVFLNKPGHSKPFLAQVWSTGRKVYLGYFATAEEAALCVARSTKGHAVAARRAAAPAPLTSEEARQQAQAEGLKLLVAENTTGYFCVHLPYPGKPKPYQVQVRRGDKLVRLGNFATAEEAALCVARSPEGLAVAAGRAAPPPLTSEEARQQAQAEGLTLLRVAQNKTGYFGVSLLSQPGKLKPFQAQLKRGGKVVYLGHFATAEEAALCVARSPEGQVAARRAASAESRGALPAVPSGAIPRETGMTPAMAPGAEPVVKFEALLLLLDDDLDLDECIGRRGQNSARLVNEEEGSGDRSKRQRKK